MENIYYVFSGSERLRDLWEKQLKTRVTHTVHFKFNDNESFVSARFFRIKISDFDLFTIKVNYPKLHLFNSIKDITKANTYLYYHSSVKHK